MSDGKAAIHASIIAAFALIFLLAMVAFAVHLLSPLRRDLILCDDAIKLTLKAPSTYKRIKAPDYYTAGSGLYMITYDAANSYGVPIQSKGACTVNPDRTGATWFRFPNSIDETSLGSGE